MAHTRQRLAALAWLTLALLAAVQIAALSALCCDTDRHHAGALECHAEPASAHSPDHAAHHLQVENDTAARLTCVCDPSDTLRALLGTCGLVSVSTAAWSDLAASGACVLSHDRPSAPAPTCLTPPPRS